MKAISLLNYPVEDVFHIFVKNAKRDFSDFDEEDATGCKIEKSIEVGRPNPVKCVVEITKYMKNEIYQITTKTDYSTCISTYNFKGQKDGSTKVVFEESQSTNKFTGYLSLWVYRFLARKNFKAKFNNIVDSLSNELRIYTSNREKSNAKK